MNRTFHFENYYFRDQKVKIKLQFDLGPDDRGNYLPILFLYSRL